MTVNGKKTRINKEGRFDYPVYGRGKETVYVYYFKTYQEYAREHGLNYFPCKIGYTTTFFPTRIWEQQAAFPEGITIPFIIRSKNAHLLETELHELLGAIRPHRKWAKYRKWKGNRCYSFGGGEDWYLTNPEEIFRAAYDRKFRNKLEKVIQEKRDKTKRERQKEIEASKRKGLELMKIIAKEKAERMSDFLTTLDTIEIRNKDLPKMIKKGKI